MVKTIVIVLAAMSGITAVISVYVSPHRWFYVFKPFTTFLIILVVLCNFNPESIIYKRLILIGLVFSLAGDVYLMLPADKFIGGLVSFLAAHVIYIIAFSRSLQQPLEWWPVLILIIFTSMVLRVILPDADKFRIPVIIYSIVIAGMVWLAMERLLILGTMKALFASLGAFLFLISDAILAIQRFKFRIPGSHASILGTYYFAQILIALSV